MILEADMSSGVEKRFEAYCNEIVKSLSHADREVPTRLYLKGLMLPGGRKSVEPMAARVHPEDVRSAHQSMHHLVAQSEWSDRSLLETVSVQVLPALAQSETEKVWIVDDTGFPKKGKHSVGVGHQYCGELGKTTNCQVMVSLSVANEVGSLPVGCQLYLPLEWAEDAERRKRAGVPESIKFMTKGQLARSLITNALEAGVEPGPVLADAAYGDEAEWRDWLSERHLTYGLGIRLGTKVWWGSHQPAPDPVPNRFGRTRVRLVRDETHQPISVQELAFALPAQSFRNISWREGEAGPLSSRFARVRVRTAHYNQPREEEWLVIEWPKGQAEPTRYWLSNLPKEIKFGALVNTLKARWRIERDYQELKQELGMGHYEGRNWRGFHHHLSLCIAAYGFLMLERIKYFKKNSARFKEPALPEGFRPRGTPANATARTLLNHHATLLSRSGYCTNSATMPLLWDTE